MIPADLAARIRMLSEASHFDNDSVTEGRTAVRETQARLSQLLPGQSFVATLQRALPDGTFQALVAGQRMILALNHSAQAGDTLELVVEKNTANLTFARLAHGAEGARNTVSQANLSQTGRMISALLTGQGGTTATQLAGGQPLLKAAPEGAQQAQQLAPALQQALTRSGLFYEAHQQQWLAGKVQTSDLLREPQGRQSPLVQDPVLAARVLTAARAAGSVVPTNVSAQLAAQAAAGAATPGSAAATNAAATASLVAVKDAATTLRTQQQAQNFAQLLPAFAGQAQMPAGGAGAGFLAEMVHNLERATRTLGQAPPPGGEGEEQAAGRLQQAAGQQAAVGREVAQLLRTQTADEALPAEQRAAAARDGAQAAARAVAEQGQANQAQRLPVPERLAPLVYQQLESMATQNYLLHGQAWPGQEFEWEIEDEGGGRSADDDEAVLWKTTLRVTMPRLGGVEARLTLARDGVVLRLLADYNDAVTDLNAARPELLEALEAANIVVSGFSAQKREQQDAARAAAPPPSAQEQAGVDVTAHETRTRTQDGQAS